MKCMTVHVEEGGRGGGGGGDLPPKWHYLPLEMSHRTSDANPHAGKA